MYWLYVYYREIKRFIFVRLVNGKYCNFTLIVGTIGAVVDDRRAARLIPRREQFLDGFQIPGLEKVFKHTHDTNTI